MFGMVKAECVGAAYASPVRWQWLDSFLLGKVGNRGVARVGCRIGVLSLRVVG